MEEANDSDFDIALITDAFLAVPEWVGSALDDLAEGVDSLVALEADTFSAIEDFICGASDVSADWVYSLESWETNAFEAVKGLIWATIDDSAESIDSCVAGSADTRSSAPSLIASAPGSALVAGEKFLKAA